MFVFWVNIWRMRSKLLALKTSDSKFHFNENQLADKNCEYPVESKKKSLSNFQKVTNVLNALKRQKLYDREQLCHSLEQSDSVWALISKLEYIFREASLILFSARLNRVEPYPRFCAAESALEFRAFFPLRCVFLKNQPPKIVGLKSFISLPPKLLGVPQPLRFSF